MGAPADRCGRGQKGGSFDLPVPDPAAIPGLQVEQQPELVVPALRPPFHKGAQLPGAKQAVRSEIAPFQRRKGGLPILPGDPSLERRREAGLWACLNGPGQPGTDRLSESNLGPPRPDDPIGGQ